MKLTRRPDTKFLEKIPEWAQRVYLVTFRRTVDGVEESYIKIGITSYTEVLDRILIAHQAFLEGRDNWVLTSMYEYFHSGSVIASAQLPTDKARELEKEVLEKWGPQDLDLPKMNGMSEIRRYTPQRYAIAKNLIQKNRYVRS